MLKNLGKGYRLWITNFDFCIYDSFWVEPYEFIVKANGLDV